MQQQQQQQSSSASSLSSPDAPTPAAGVEDSKRQRKGPMEVEFSKEFNAGFGSEALNREVLQALKRLVPRGSKPAATFIGVIKSKRGTGDFGMVYCYNVPDLVTAALHYAVDQGIDPKLVSNCRYERFERSDVLGLPDKPGSLTLHRVLAALIHPKLFDADFQRDFRRLTGLKPAVLDTDGADTPQRLWDKARYELYARCTELRSSATKAHKLKAILGQEPPASSNAAPVHVAASTSAAAVHSAAPVPAAAAAADPESAAVAGTRVGTEPART
jgi:hypothetical protein